MSDLAPLPTPTMSKAQEAENFEKQQQQLTSPIATSCSQKQAPHATHDEIPELKSISHEPSPIWETKESAKLDQTTTTRNVIETESPKHSGSSSKKRATPILERRRRKWEIQDDLLTTEAAKPGAKAWAIVAFGSNMGDRVACIEYGLDRMRKAGLEIVRLSSLYETAPMYFTDQAKFLNGVAVIQTNQDPLNLLRTLQNVEIEAGRTWDPQKPKGPRTLDLDILFYQGVTMDQDELRIPHPGILERDFVLCPLCDVAQYYPLCMDDRTGTPVTAPIALQRLKNRTPMQSVTRLTEGQHVYVSEEENFNRTQIMSILNITPDSFSDGGILFEGANSDLDRIKQVAQSHIDAGATILDVGGQSTRPGATTVGADEELSRVLPVLRAIQSLPSVASGGTAVSLDTFYSSVAKACAQENLVDIINDVSGGLRDPDMFSTVAEIGKTYVLMHARGTPQNMNDPEFTNYGSEGVVKSVAKWLSHRIQAANAAGIYPWRIILDPGLGFAKDLQGNLDLLREGVYGLEEEWGRKAGRYPWLYGPSRKGFIGYLANQKAKEGTSRDWGTAAAVSAAVAGGAHIVRIHNTATMKDVVQVADGIWKNVIRDSSKQ